MITTLTWLNQQGKRPFSQPADSIWLSVYAYDLRLAVWKRHQRFQTRVGYHQTKQKVVSCPGNAVVAGSIGLQHHGLGPQRFGFLSNQAPNNLACCGWFRDAFHIAGCLSFDAKGHIVQISLNQAHQLAAPFIDAFASFLARDGTAANLRQI